MKQRKKVDGTRRLMGDKEGTFDKTVRIDSQERRKENKRRKRVGIPIPCKHS